MLNPTGPRTSMEGNSLLNPAGADLKRVITPQLIFAIRRKYDLDWTGLHGVRHWARVRKVGLELARVTGARTNVVELFSFLHDSCRRGDGHDPDHGRRAVGFATQLRADCLELDDEDFTLLCEAIEYHSEGHLGADVTVQTCWDADRLDLERVGIQPEPHKVCTEAARKMISRTRPLGTSLTPLGTRT